MLQEQKDRNLNSKAEYRKTLISALRPYRGKIAFGLTAAALASLFDAIGPMLLRSGVNALQESKPVGWLYGFSGLIIIAAFIGGVFRFYMRNTVIRVSRRVESNIRENYFSHLLSLAPAFFDRNLTGDLMARATDDIERVRLVLGPALQMFVGTVLTILFSAVMMFYLDTGLAAIVLILAPVIGGMVLAVASRLYKVNLRQQVAYGKVEALVQENLSGIRIIKSFVREDYESSRFVDSCKTYFKRSMDVVLVQSIFMPLLTLLVGVGIVAILWVGGQKVSNGVMGLGDFIAFMSYLSLMTWPMIALGWMTHLYQRGGASNQRLKEILSIDKQFADTDSESYNGTYQKPPAISFNEIDFRYDGTDMAVFEKLNLTVPAGTTLAIVGRTGSGKSSLVRLLARLYSPQNGSITIDEKRWDQIDQVILRRIIGYVDQTPFLFSATIRDNLIFGKPEATDDEVTFAARTAGFEHDLDGFPDGYNTRIGERGVTLSGGQQQRLTLARALIINPAILILDDALSAVDAETEAEILENLSRNLKNSTVLFVTHRLSAAERADSIAVLAGGSVIESGGHEELLELNGVYAAMYRRQRLAEELGAMK